MRQAEDLGPLPEPLRKEAADWFARMHGPAADSSRAAFEAWICAPDNARAYRQLSARWDQSAFIGSTETGRARSLRQASFMARHRRAVAAAASILLVASGAVLLAPRFTVGGSHSGLTAAPQRLEATQIIRSVTLADQSRVTLDEGSLLLVAYSRSRRDLVLERGRARFEVAHDPRRPFVVAAAGSEVVAHGTVFDVAVRGRTATVILLNGSVSVGRRGAPGVSRRLRAGEQLVLSPDQALPPPAPAQPESSAWLQSMVEFRDTPLSEAAAQVEMGGDRIRFSGDTGSLHITGSFRRGDVRALAQSAAAMFELKLERVAPGEFLISRPEGVPKKHGG